MGLLGIRKPNVGALARRMDVRALAEAARYRSRSAEFNDTGAPVREQAVLAIGALGPAAADATLTDALRDPAEPVRVAAVRVLHARGQTDDLIEALDWLPAQGQTRGLVIQALLVGKPRGAARAVAGTLVRAEGEAPLSEADFALVRTLIDAEDNPDVANEVVDALLSSLVDEREAVADRAEELLTRLAPASTEGLIAELQGGAAPDRAAWVLGRICDSRALEPLVDSLHHRDPEVRGQSAAALGELRDTAAVEPLVGATRDPDRFVRASAGAALDRLGTAAKVLGMSNLMSPAICEAVTTGSRLAPAQSAPPPARHDLGSLRDALESARGPDG